MGQKPDVTAVDIRALVRDLLGGGQVHVAPVSTEGMETHAYRVSGGDRAGCLRIGRATRGFAKDRWAHDRLGDSLPIPRVWEIGQVDDERAFCLTEWLPGQTLQDINATDVDAVMPAVFDAWSDVADSNVEDITGYGDFDPDTLVAPYGTWQELLCAPAENVASWDPDWAASRVGQIGELLDIYDVLVDRCPSDRHLVHGDWGANNLLVAGGRVTGLLDWEAAAIGDPLYDVAKHFWTTWPPVITCMTRQATYCDALFGDQPEYRYRVLCYDLHLGFHEIGAALADGDRTFADWAFRRCQQLVREDTHPLQ